MTEMISPQDCIYDAFISYRHVEEDRKWARWLVHALETYRVPKALQKKGYPKRLNRVFRDEDELPTSASLSDNIETALNSSKFLIVICSRSTPESLWVDKEVATFRELGRGDRILALLIDGEPDSAFPPSLKQIKTVEIATDGTKREVIQDVEPLAADVRLRSDESMKQLKHLARLRIIAAILGCRFDDLRQRDKERHRKKRRLQMSVSAFLILLLGLVAIAWWDYTRLKVSYFNHMVFRRGVPEGVGAITREAQAHRHISFRFENRKSKLVRVCRINGSGSLIDDEDGNSIWIPEYRSDGTILRLKYLNHNQVPGVIHHFSPDLATVEFKRADGLPWAKGIKGLEMDAREQNRSMIIQSKGKYDERGFPVQEEYRQDDWGTPAQDGFGSFGRIYTRSDTGLILAEYEIDAKGDPKMTRSGISGKRYAYDGDTNLIEVMFLDASGNPVNAPERGYAFEKMTYDRWGNLIRGALFNCDSQPACDIPSGVSSYEYAYDARGNQVGLKCYGVDGKPVVTTWGWHHWQKDFDPFGFPVSVSFHDDLYLPRALEDGYSKISYQYDQRGNVISESYFGADNRAVLTKQGYARISWSYNQQGELIEEIFYGLDDKPISSEEGYASTVYKWDARGNRIEMAFYDESQKPAADRTGLHKVITEYDQRGNDIAWSYYGPNGKPTWFEKEYARCEIEYNAQGNAVAWSYFGPDGKPVDLKNGYARLEKEYDGMGNVVAWSHYDAGGQPVIDRETEWWKKTRKFDARGNEIEQAYYDIEGSLKFNMEEGCARLTFLYDKDGNLTETAHFGSDNQLIKHPVKGYARVTWKFNPHAKTWSEVAYWDEFGKPVVNPEEGYAKSIRKYNPAGLLTEFAAFGAGDGYVLFKGRNFARVTQKHDPNGNVTEQAFYDSEGWPVLTKSGYAKVTSKYNADGKLIETAFLGTDDRPVMTPWGYAAYNTDYDAQGLQIMESFYGPDGMPVMLTGYCAKWEKEFDRNGNLLREIYFDDQGKPCVPKSKGFAICTHRYDENGNRIETGYYDAENTLTIPDEVGYARCTKKFDEWNNEIEIRNFGKDNKPLDYKTLLGDSYAVMISKYDENNRKIEEIRLDSSGKPIRHSDGYVRWRKRFDDAGNVIEMAYFGENNKPVLTRKGFSFWRADYDESGEIEEIAFFNEKHAPVLVGPGFYKWKAEYNRFGKLASGSFFDEKGNPFLFHGEYARAVFKYDGRGIRSGAEYYGTDGKPVLLKEGFSRWEANTDPATGKRNISFFNLRDKIEFPHVSGIAEYLINLEEYSGKPSGWMQHNFKLLDDSIIKSNLPLVQSIASSVFEKETMPQGITQEDLIRIGLQEFVKAYGDSDQKFSLTYCADRVKAGLLVYLEAENSKINNYLRLVQKKNQKLSDEIVRKHLPMIQSIAATVASAGKLPPGIVFNDLISYGYEGLVKAYQTYNPSSGQNPETYFAYGVKGEILDRLRAEWKSKHPTAYRELQDGIQNRITGVVNDMLESEEDNGSDAERKKRAAEIVENSAIVYLLSLNVVKKEQLNEEFSEKFEFANERFMLWEEVDKLNYEEKEFVRLFYEAEKNPEEIAKILGLEKAEAVKLHGKILNHLRKRLKLKLSEIFGMLLKKDKWVRIEKILPDGPAARSNQLHIGDRVVAFGESDQNLQYINELSLEAVFEQIRKQSEHNITLIVIPESSPILSQPIEVELIQNQTG